MVDPGFNSLKSRIPTLVGIFNIMLTKEKKREIVSELEKKLTKSKSVVFANFHGLTVADSMAMRKALRDEGVSYSVARKTLINRALDSVKLEGEKPQFKNELALACGDDLIAPARGIYEFQKKLEGKVSIVGGLFEGRYMNAEEMLEIASIPPIDVLRGMFVNIINSPIQRFVIALDQITKVKS